MLLGGPCEPSCSGRTCTASLWQSLPQQQHLPSRWPRSQPCRSHVVRSRRREPLIAPFIDLPSHNAEQQGLGEMMEAPDSLYSFLLKQRIIYIGGRITEETSLRVCASLMALESISDADIRLYINSQGGSPYYVVSILDMMAAIKPKISTTALGLTASSATLLLAAGAKGKRFCMPNARIMMHSPAGGAMGSADEVMIQAKELNRTMRVVHRFYEKFTGLPLERIEVETDRDNFMSGHKAIELGLVDHVL